MNVIDIIFRELQNYSTRNTTITTVTSAVIQVLKEYGYTVTEDPDKLMGSRVIEVDGHRYRIVRNRDWLRYYVTQLD